ncbi:uncharacterized protein LOC111136381, partial [Crassostrea virginica]
WQPKDRTSIFTFLRKLTLISSLGSVAPPFVNETIVTGTEVRISWLIEDTHLNITSFRISYEALDHQESVTRVLDGSLRSVTLRHLYPLTKYSFLMVTIADSGLFSNASESVEFTTTADPEEANRVRVHSYELRPEEVIFILIVVAVWIVAMVLFYKQWDSIRILQPMEPRYKHNPKNLESIRIVKRPQDSVIYKNYSRKLSITMDEREKRRLQRMNTEPVLPSVARLSALPTIHMEEATTEM